MEILDELGELHKDLTVYRHLKEIDKPIVVSGLLLALREIEFKNFSIEKLTGDIITTDGDKIFDAIKSNLIRSNISPETKREKILTQFSIIKGAQILNEKNTILNKTPLKHYIEFLNAKIYRSIKYSISSEDYLGRFYGEFLSCSGGDGQTLGIVLTPKHVCDLIYELLNLKVDDIVFAPCTGTGGFLVSAMHKMLLQSNDDEEKKKYIKQKQLHGIEIDSYMFTIATTNMILRGDGKTNIVNENFFNESPKTFQLKGATIGVMNPPYSQGSITRPNLYELGFTEHLLDSLLRDAKAAVVLPQASMVGKTNIEKFLKQNILKKHTLEGVITLNEQTFYRVGTMPCIAIFTAGTSHPKDKKCKFVDFREDGYKLKKNIGLVETEITPIQKQNLLDVWFERKTAKPKFCIQTTIKPTDEWLHAFFYFDDSVPTNESVEEAIKNYLISEFSMIMQNREYLFTKNNVCKKHIEYKKIEDLCMKKWGAFFIKDLFDIFSEKNPPLHTQKAGPVPYVSSSSQKNGISKFIQNKGSSLGNGYLSVNINGSVGYSFFHPYSAVFSNDTRKLKSKNYKNFSEYFLSAQIMQQKDKYSYGYKMGTERLKKQKIMLPINKQGSPDYEFMGQFVQNIIYKKYKQYLRFVGPLDM